MGQNRSYPIVADWDVLRLQVMRIAIHAKFTQDPKLGALLLSTGDRLLEEDNRRDAFWGVGHTQKGKNMLGVILMETRQKLRDDTSAKRRG